MAPGMSLCRHCRTQGSRQACEVDVRKAHILDCKPETQREQPGSRHNFQGHLEACPQWWIPSPPKTPQTSPFTGDHCSNAQNCGVPVSFKPHTALRKWLLHLFAVYYAGVSAWGCQYGSSLGARLLVDLSAGLWWPVVWLFRGSRSPDCLSRQRNSALEKAVLVSENLVLLNYCRQLFWLAILASWDEIIWKSVI